MPWPRFSVFGYHVTGSTGTLFLYGIVVGAVGLLGLSLLLAGARRNLPPRPRRAPRAQAVPPRDRRVARDAAVAKDRDDLIDQRDTARAYTASVLGDGAPSGNGAPPAGLNPSPDDGRRSRPRLFGAARRAAVCHRARRHRARRGAGWPARPRRPGRDADLRPRRPGRTPAPDVPAGAPAPNVPAGAPTPAE